MSDNSKTELMSNIRKKVTGQITDHVISEVVKLLFLLVGKDEEQIALLKKIDKNITKLIEVPFKDGKDFLSDARFESNPTPSIIRARDRFITAANQTSDAIKPMAEFYVGVCYSLLNNHTNALRWYERSYISGLRFLRNLIAIHTGQNISWPKSIATTILFISGIGIPVAFLMLAPDYKRQLKVSDPMFEMLDMVRDCCALLHDLGSKIPQLKPRRDFQSFWIDVDNSVFSDL